MNFIDLTSIHSHIFSNLIPFEFPYDINFVWWINLFMIDYQLVSPDPGWSNTNALDSKKFLGSQTVINPWFYLVKPQFLLSVNWFSIDLILETKLCSSFIPGEWFDEQFHPFLLPLRSAPLAFGECVLANITPYHIHHVYPRLFSDGVILMFELGVYWLVQSLYTSWSLIYHFNQYPILEHSSETGWYNTFKT